MRTNPTDSDGPSGVLLIDKAEDMTSHDVVAIARRALNTKKIGHCGTLDPMATGLLMLVIGRATKIQDLLMSEDKQYVGTLTLGSTTSTQDRQGDTLETLPVGNYSEAEVHQVFDGFMGDFEQIPPMVSAIKSSSTTPDPLGIADTGPSANAPQAIAMVRRASSTEPMQQIFTFGGVISSRLPRSLSPAARHDRN